jgi:hypothetical protein
MQFSAKQAAWKGPSMRAFSSRLQARLVHRWGTKIKSIDAMRPVDA